MSHIYNVSARVVTLITADGPDGAQAKLNRQLDREGYSLLDDGMSAFHSETCECEENS